MHFANGVIINNENDVETSYEMINRTGLIFFYWQVAQQHNQ